MHYTLYMQHLFTDKGSFGGKVQLFIYASWSANMKDKPVNEIGRKKLDEYGMDGE